MTNDQLTSARRLPRVLAAAAALLGAGSATATVALTAHPSHSGAARPTAAAHVGPADNFPYFLCVAVENTGICVGPPTN